MTDKEPIKLKLSTVILSFIIFILIIGMILMYFYFTNSRNTTNTVENATTDSTKNVLSGYTSNTTVSNTESEKLDSTVKQLDINSDEVQKLYKYIEKTNEAQEELVYRNTKVTEKDLNNQLKLLTIFENIPESAASNEKNITDEYGNTSKHIYYSKDTIENMAKKIFGNGATITHESCEGLFARAKEYKNGEYDCYEYQGGGGYWWILSCYDLVSAEQKGDELYIYDKYVHVYQNDNSGSTYGIYDSSDKSNIISKNARSETLLDGVGDFSAKVLINNANKITNNKIKTFKHTFKKNTDGSYYWYSTEPLA